MKRMWIDFKPDQDFASLKERLKEIGTVEEAPEQEARIILTFHNQSQGGMRMAGFRLTEDFIESFEDFGMVSQES